MRIGYDEVGNMIARTYTQVENHTLRKAGLNHLIVSLGSMNSDIIICCTVQHHSTIRMSKSFSSEQGLIATRGFQQAVATGQLLRQLVTR